LFIRLGFLHLLFHFIYAVWFLASVIFFYFFYFSSFLLKRSPLSSHSWKQPSAGGTRN